MANARPPIPHRAKGFRNPGDTYTGRTLQPKDKKKKIAARPGEEEASLADQFIAATYTDHTSFFGHTRRLAEAALTNYRIAMRKAHRFVLTDGFTEMATILSFAAPEKTLARIQYATLPYDTTWIEFNLRAKMRVIHQTNGTGRTEFDDVAPRLGMLLQRIDDVSAVCTLVSTAGDGGEPRAHMTCYFFSTVEAEFKQGRMVFGCKMLSLKADDDAFVTKSTLWGYTDDPRSRVLDTAKSLDHLHTPEFLLRHGDVGVSAMYPTYFDLLKGDQKDVTKLSELLAGEISEFTGTVRWLATVLAMLNEVPVSTERVERSGFLRAGRVGKNKLLDYHKVTLQLPKTDPIKYFNRKLSHAEIARRRAHEVRSHWRTYLHETRCAREEHDWVYDNEHGYRLCGKCEAYGRLIHEHIRGDIKLGWVRKDYIIKPAQETHHEDRRQEGGRREETPYPLCQQE